MIMQLEYEQNLSDNDKKLINQHYNYEQVRDDLSHQFKTNFFKYIFKRHFDDYMGRSDAMKQYLKVEVLGMYVFVLIAILMTCGFYYMRYHISPFNDHKIMSDIAIGLVFLAIFVTIFIFMLATYNAIRVLRYKNIYGILFGLLPTHYLMHSMQYTYVLKNDKIIIPIYFSINVNETDFDQIYFDNTDILSHDLRNDIMQDQYDSNERFINTLHYVLIEHKLRQFDLEFKDLDAYQSLLKSTKGTMLK